MLELLNFIWLELLSRPSELLYSNKYVGGDLSFIQATTLDRSIIWDQGTMECVHEWMYSSYIKEAPNLDTFTDLVFTTTSQFTVTHHSRIVI